MHVLHITGSYGGTEVYKNLFTALDKLGVRQTVFVPLNASNHNRIGNHLIDFEVQGSKIVYSTVLKPYHRFLYGQKVKTIVGEVEEMINMADVDVIHAATLCIDGAVAYELQKKYNIPYLLAVRNTDISVYYKYFKWRLGYFSKIFTHAARVIFICPQYKDYFLNKKMPQRIAVDLSRIEVIPNGVDALFLNKRSRLHRTLNAPIRIVFVSAFVQNKCLKEIIEAISIVRERMKLDIKFDAIGKGLPYRKEKIEYVTCIEQLANKYCWVTLHDYMSKEELCKFLSQCDIYVMPSKPETFGLVYVEALSQNLPIVYGKGEGFDGYFTDGLVGYAAIPFDVNDIAEKIELVIKSYERLEIAVNELDLYSLFSWENIAKKYFDIYRSIK